MKIQLLPKIDSIQELAQFWDRNDLTDFEEELEEVTEPIFGSPTGIPLNLESDEAEVVRSPKREDSR